MNLLKKVSVFFILTSLLGGCSLNYGSQQNSENTVPEFSFTDANFDRYSKNKVTMTLKSEKLEQYKNGGGAYAANAEFKTFDEQGILKTEGKCQLLAADTKNKKYTLFDNVSINIPEQETQLTANSLHFDANNEQLTGGITDTVSILRNGTEVKGQGFSASGVSRKYTFLRPVTGSVTDSHDQNMAEGDEQ